MHLGNHELLEKSKEGFNRETENSSCSRQNIVEDTDEANAPAFKLGLLRFNERFKQLVTVAESDISDEGDGNEKSFLNSDNYELDKEQLSSILFDDYKISKVAAAADGGTNEYLAVTN